MKNKKIIFLLTLTSLLTSCNNYEGYIHHTNSFILNKEIILPLYTDVSLSAYYNNDTLSSKDNINEVFDNAIYQIHKEADRKNSFDGINNIKTINDSYGTGNKIIVNETLFNLLKTGVELTKLTDGYFNVGIGNLIDAYGDRFDYPGLVIEDVDKNDILKALNDVPTVTDYDSMLEFDSSDYSIKFNQITGKDVVISLGGICKGLACDVAKNNLKDNNIPSIISCGGSSISTIGNKPSSKYWNIGIKLPLVGAFFTSIGMTVKIEGEYNISTSGDNEQNYYALLEDGTTVFRNHILNPYTGYSSNYHNQVFVISKDANGMILDATTTALMNIESLEDIKKQVKVIEDYYNVSMEYLVVDTNNDDSTFVVHATENLKKMLDKDVSEMISSIEII